MFIIYRKCIISKSRSPKFNTPYYSIFNPEKRRKDDHEKNCHVHASSIDEAKAIIDSFRRIEKYGFDYKHNRHIKNLALGLLGMKVMY